MSRDEELSAGIGMTQGWSSTTEPTSGGGRTHQSCNPGAPCTAFRELGQWDSLLCSRHCAPRMCHSLYIYINSWTGLVNLLSFKSSQNLCLTFCVLMEPFEFRGSSYMTIDGGRTFSNGLGPPLPKKQIPHRGSRVQDGRERVLLVDLAKEKRMRRRTGEKPSVMAQHVCNPSTLGLRPCWGIW